MARKDMKEIPKKVSEAADRMGCNSVEYVGVYKDAKVFGIGQVDEDGFPMPTGLPTLILWDGETAKIIGGEDSLLILSSLD